jgi:hypothetical protein
MKTLRLKPAFLLSIVAMLVIAPQTFGQELPTKITKDDLAKNNKLFIELASKALKWDVPADPI